MQPPLSTLFDFSNKTAIITGGSSGIGRATAILLAECGARVWTGDLRTDPANRAEFEPLGITETVCDVRSEAAVQQFITMATNATKRLDFVIHSAGVNMVVQLPDAKEADWDKCIDTNLKGAFLLVKHSIPHLKQSGGGAITLVSSNAGFLPRAHDPLYSTSKGSVNAMTRSFALCHGLDKIRINAVCPGPVTRTGIINDMLDSAADREKLERAIIASAPLCRALDRMVTPEEVAQSIAFLSSSAATMITGTLLAIDGGKSLGVPPA
jgi:NAD(P)-dependent dehydrogenase (short-subunit alcohol dehydrogenase family)